jgi:hypothetical protein
MLALIATGVSREWWGREAPCKPGEHLASWLAGCCGITGSMAESGQYSMLYCSGHPVSTWMRKCEISVGWTHLCV